MQLAAELAIRGDRQLASIAAHTGQQLLQGSDRQQPDIAKPLQAGWSQLQEALLAAAAGEALVADKPAHLLLKVAPALALRCALPLRCRLGALDPARLGGESLGLSAPPRGVCNKLRVEHFQAGTLAPRVLVRPELVELVMQTLRVPAPFGGPGRGLLQ